MIESPESAPIESPPPTPAVTPLPVDRSRIRAAIESVSGLIALVVVRSIPGVGRIPGASDLLAATIQQSFSPVLGLDDDTTRALVYALAQELGATVGQRDPPAWSDPELAAAARALLEALG